MVRIISRRNIVTILIPSLILILTFILAFFIQKSITFQPVTSFDQCVAKGYSVLESYPRQCTTPDGENFTELMPGVSVVEQIQPTSIIITPIISTKEAEIDQEVIQ